jgi:hypothetical protein
MTVFKREPSSKLLMAVGLVSKGSWRKAGKGFKEGSSASEMGRRSGSRSSHIGRDLIFD